MADTLGYLSATFLLLLAAGPKSLGRLGLLTRFLGLMSQLRAGVILGWLRLKYRCIISVPWPLMVPLRRVAVSLIIVSLFLDSHCPGDDDVVVLMTTTPMMMMTMMTMMTRTTAAMTMTLTITMTTETMTMAMSIR